VKNTTELKEFAQLAQASYALLQVPVIYSNSAMGVSFAFFLEQPCHVAHALN
jgi:hypothetical protein